MNCFPYKETHFFDFIQFPSFIAQLCNLVAHPVGERRPRPNHQDYSPPFASGAADRWQPGTPWRWWKFVHLCRSPHGNEPRSYASSSRSNRRERGSLHHGRDPRRTCCGSPDPTADLELSHSRCYLARWLGDGFRSSAHGGASIFNRGAGQHPPPAGTGILARGGGAR